MDTQGNPLNSSNPVQVQIAAAGIALPQDLQTVYKKNVWIDTTTLGISQAKVQANPGTDVSSANRVVGFFNGDQILKLTVAHSHDGTNWYTDPTTFQMSAASTAMVFDVKCYGNYIRYTFTNTAATACTFSVLVGYSTPQGS